MLVAARGAASATLQRPLHSSAIYTTQPLPAILPSLARSSARALRHRSPCLRCAAGSGDGWASSSENGRSNGATPHSPALNASPSQTPPAPPPPGEQRRLPDALYFQPPENANGAPQTLAATAASTLGTTSDDDDDDDCYITEDDKGVLIRVRYLWFMIQAGNQSCMYSAQQTKLLAAAALAAAELAIAALEITTRNAMTSVTSFGVRRST